MAKIVVVFDFDKTIIDCDSDNWVIDNLGATDRFDDLLRTLPWNSAMDEMMTELHLRGKTMEDISDGLKRAPLHPNIVRAIKSAYSLRCELRIVSDANRFFIETVLEHHGLTGYFSEIVTNPSYVDEEGKLRIFPYHNFAISSHGCGLGQCPPNMCKGVIMERIRECCLAEGKKRFVYLGDGKGDYCPSLKLREDDYVMPRTDYPLWELIRNDPKALKADVHEWSNAVELEAVLLGIVNEVVSVDCGDAGQLLPMDCKFRTIPVSVNEVLPQALLAPH